MNIFEFKNYRDYLKSLFGAEGKRTGERKKLAQAIGVHSTLVSLVMNGSTDFTLEQGEAINLLLGHSSDESEYFLLLLTKARAGTEQLRQRVEQRIQSLIETRANISGRLSPDKEISAEDSSKFYSSYLYGFIHVLVSIPTLNTVDKLAQALQISRTQTNEIVSFLIRIGLVIEKSGKLTYGPKHVHLGKNSDLIIRHHTNYRLHTLQNIHYANPTDLHYSACWSLSHEDAQKIRELLLNFLKQQTQIVSASKEETAYVAAFDFYSIL